MTVILSRCMCVVKRGGGASDISTAECVVETFTLNSYKSQVLKAYSQYDNDILFVWCYFNQRPPLIQPSIPTPHTGCKLISHLKGTKGMVVMMFVIWPSNSPGHTYMGP